ncbi:sensor domain-containing diguanylate cyclase [Vibrio campbellii]|uniref:sensor domain-containing diguanylate cyclase n=1 Tax=Vibrio campbellii TaxID=680 RepID=UPI00039EECA2|nr:sensor domain-containing diguanylate cyclase [Vibrio campbellii]
MHIDPNYASEQSLMSVLSQNFPGFIAVRKENGKHVALNQRYRAFFEEDILGVSIDTMIANCQNDDLCDLLMQCKRNDQALLDGNAPMRVDIETFQNHHFESMRYLTDVNGVRHIVLMAWDITARIEEQNRLKQSLHFDHLTGAMNKKALMSAVQKGCDCCLVAYLDLDKFKQVNDTYGHAIGDKVLVDFATLTMQQLGESGTLYRVGGDEFVIVFDCMQISDARETLLQIRQVVESDIHLHGISFSFGLMACNDNLEQCLEDADKALYQDKHARKQG